MRVHRQSIIICALYASMGPMVCKVMQRAGHICFKLTTWPDGGERGGAQEAQGSVRPDPAHAQARGNLPELGVALKS